jgi:hypothetical protein
MKHIAIRKSYSYFLTDSEEVDSCEMDEKLQTIQKELEQVLLKHGVSKDFGYTTFYGIDKYSITNCTKCNTLMLNRDKNPAGIPEVDNDISAMLVDGGESSGKVLCEDCLPKRHRWAFE